MQAFKHVRRMNPLISDKLFKSLNPVQSYKSLQSLKVKRIRFTNSLALVIKSGADTNFAQRKQQERN